MNGHRTEFIQKNGQSLFYTATLVVNNRPIKFIIDTGSPVTLIPKTRFTEVTAIKPVTMDYRDVNDNKFEGKTKAKRRVGRYKTTIGGIDNNQKHSLTTRILLDERTGNNC